MDILPRTVLNSRTPDGERRVRRLLEASLGSPGAFAIHSLNLPDHEYKRLGEADFLIVDQRGLLLLEVKGGIVRYAEGEWRFENGRGARIERSEGPHRQAESAIQAVRRMLSRLNGPPLRVFGWAIVLPFSYWTQPHPEIADEIVLDRRTCGNGADFTQALDKAFSYWAKRSVVSGRKPSRLDTQAVQNLLLPQFHFAPAPARCADAIEEEIVRLSNEQAEILEGLANNPRLLVEGGAGTGKTILASAAAAAATNDDASVGFVVAAPVLASHLAYRLPSVSVVGLNQLGHLPAKSFDVLVVDEGQELANPNGLASIDRLLKGGLDKGRWRWFMDPDHQALYANVDLQCVNQLRNCAASFRLGKNVRSTRQIVNLVRMSTGADVGISDIDARGMLPRVDIAGDADDTVSRSVAQAVQWLDSGVQPEAIALLAAEADLPMLDAESARQLGRMATRVAQPSDLLAARRSVITCDPSTFRGMERQFISIACTDSFSKLPRNESFLYVALTRARAGLSAYVSADAAGWFDTLQNKYGET